MAEAKVTTLYMVVTEPLEWEKNRYYGVKRPTRIYTRKGDALRFIKENSRRKATMYKGEIEWEEVQ